MKGDEAAQRMEDQVRPQEDSAMLEPVPYGFCHCRCGGRTGISKKTDHHYGHVKGQPFLYLKGHHMRVYSFDFWSRVDKTTTPDGCWPWIGWLNKYGYGQVWFNGRYEVAHRIAWLLQNGPIEHEWLWPYIPVLHSCDNRPCCNPSHLSLGTPRMNTEDMMAKGRQARGARNGNAKLGGQEEADEIRRLYAAGGISQGDLGLQFGLSQSRISEIVRGKGWGLSWK
jgi:HNH endonuclease